MTTFMGTVQPPSLETAHSRNISLVVAAPILQSPLVTPSSCTSPTISIPIRSFAGSIWGIGAGILLVTLSGSIAMRTCPSTEYMSLHVWR